MLLKCFAKAVSRHIDFSKGYLIFEDMKKYSSMKDKMKFTYNQNKNMKIDMERLKKKANQNKLDKEKEVKSKEHSDEPHQSNRTECAGEQATATEIVGLNSKSDKSKMNLEDLAKHRITINDSEILDGTINGNTLLTQTNVFEVENKLKTSICQSSLNKFGKDETYDLSNSVISSKMFNLSNDSTVRLSESQISSFVTTFDNKGVSTLKSSTSGFGDSLAYSNTALSMLKETSKCIPLEVIKSEDGESSSRGNIEENHQENDDLDVNEDIDRFEEVDVKDISCSSTGTYSKRKRQKALLTSEEIEQAHKERDELNSSSQTHAEYALQCKDFIESGKYNLEDFKKAMGENLYESIEIMNVTTNEGFNSYIETQMLKFHPNYDFDLEQMVDKDLCKSSISLVDTFVVQRPTQEEIYYYAKYIVLLIN